MSFIELKKVCKQYPGTDKKAVTDFDLEMQMAQSNRMVAKDVDTVFLSTSTQYSYLSSSVVKEYARYGVDLTEFVPGCIIPKLITRMNELDIKKS